MKKQVYPYQQNNHQKRLHCRNRRYQLQLVPHIHMPKNKNRMVMNNSYMVKKHYNTSRDDIISYLCSQGWNFFLQKFTGPGPVSTRNLLVLNIGMKEIEFVEHKINLLVTEWHILFKMSIFGWQFNTWSDAAVHLIL